MKYTFRPSLFITIVTVLLMALCVKLGLWQYNKAITKTLLQAQLTQRLALPPVSLPDKIENLADWRYRRVKLIGSYETQYQIFLDNQVEKTVAGYHVLTPFKIEQSSHYVLVDRGWVGSALSRTLPLVTTPDGMLEIVGDITLPPPKFFTLESPANANEKWQSVWQNMDIKRYAKAVSFKVYPLLVRLDPAVKQGGFVRNWPKLSEGISKHLGYAYQWFGFALTLLGIYIVLNVKKVER